jgi:hypothetical protein
MLSESDKIGAGDPRDLAVVEKRFDERFSARPDYLWAGTWRVAPSARDIFSARTIYPGP